MTITLIDSGEGIPRAGEGFETSFVTASVAVGDMIVAYMRWVDNNITALTITCSGESNLALINSTTGANSYNPILGGPNGTSGHWAYLSATTGTGAKTIGCTPAGPSANGYCICIWVLRGTNGLDDVPVSATGNSTTPTVNKTTTQTKDAIMAVVRSDGGAMSAPGSGYSAFAALTDFYGYDDAEYILDAGAAGSETVDCTSASGNWMIHALAVKSADGVASSGGGPLTEGGLTNSVLTEGRLVT